MVSLKSDVAGTEYFDFSTDVILWDTLPVSGFTVTSNVHESHTAVKGKRYFRLRFENGGSSKSTSFRVNTYYGVFRQGGTQYTNADATDISSGTGTLILGEDTSNNPRALAVDTSGHLQVDVLSGGGGGTQYTADTDTFSTSKVVTTAGVVRNDALTSLVNADEDITALQVNSQGALYVCNSGVQSSNNTSTTNVGGQTTINEGAEFSDSDTTLTVTDGTVFTNGQTIKVDNEYMTISGIATNDLTVSRGAFNSTAVAHDDGSDVTGVFIGTSEVSNYPDITCSLKSDTAGTLYFDFSNDNTLWDTYPVAGFTVAANIHEYHTAVKNSRYFRVRFENDSSSQTTSFRVYTYFGDYKLGKLPLNQGIGSDQDSMVVRAVGVGEAPTGSYLNTKQDGSAFRTTSNLGGTLIDNVGGYTSGEITSITVDSTASFGDSGHIYIGSEFIAYASKTATTFNTLTRGEFGTTAAAISDNDVVGEAYNSGILTLEGYTEVATKLLCSNTGRGRFIWYSDSAGTDPIRTLPPSYPPSLSTYQVYWMTLVELFYSLQVTT